MKRYILKRIIAILMAITLTPTLVYAEETGYTDTQTGIDNYTVETDENIIMGESDELAADIIDFEVPEVDAFQLPEDMDDFQSETADAVINEAQPVETNDETQSAEDITENTDIITESVPDTAIEAPVLTSDAPTVVIEETPVLIEGSVQTNAKLAEAAPGITVTTVRNKAVLSLTKGDVIQLAVDGREIKSCKSSKRKVASVSKAGVLTARKQGKSKVTVNLKGKGRKKITVTVKVTDPTLPSRVSITNGKSVTLHKGETLQLSAVLAPETAQSGLTWKSSKKKVASINGSGIVTAKKKGKTKITVKTRNGKKATITVKVVKGSASTTEDITPTVTPTGHVHDFQPVTEQVWVVDKPYWVEGTWEYRSMVGCNGCGRLFDTGDEISAHRGIVLIMRDELDTDNADYVLQQLNYAINYHNKYNAPDTNNVDPLIQQMIDKLTETRNVADIREMGKQVIAQETAGGPTEDPVSGRTWTNHLDGSKCQANGLGSFPFKLDYFVENPVYPQVNKPHVAEGHYETRTVYKCSCGAVQ